MANIPHVTAFTKEWKDLELHKTREITHEVKVILEKNKDGVHISVHLEGLRGVHPIFEYGIAKNTMLIYASSPKDYDGTEEDKMKKIAETVADAEIIYEGEGQIINLQDAINEFNMEIEKIYSIKNQMRSLYKAK